MGDTEGLVGGGGEGEDALAFPGLRPVSFRFEYEAGMKTDDYFVGVQDHARLKNP